jgi:SPOR domain
MQRLTLFVILAIATIGASAQGVGVKNYIQQVAAGWTTDAKKALPDLLIDAPDDPAVMFLHAALIDDPKKASPMLERIVEAYPKSEWADDALARLVVMSATKNESDRARKYFSTMRDQYSQSDLLPLVYDVMRSTVGAPAPSDKVTPTPVSAKKLEISDQTKAGSTKPYTIVLKTYSNKKDADSFAESMKQKRMPAKVGSYGASKKFSVRVGEYATDADAQKEIEYVRSVCKCKATIEKR